MNLSDKRLVRIGIGVTCAVGVAVFVAGSAPAVRSLAAAAGSVSPPALLAGVVLSMLAILNRGGLNRATHQTAGLPAAPLSMVRPAAVGFAANKILRSGGASGAAVFVRHGEAHRYPTGSVIAACALAALASMAALGFVMLSAVALLAASGTLTGWWIAAAVGFALYATLVAVAVTIAARRRDLLHRTWGAAAGLVARLRRRPAPSGSTAVDDFAGALHSVRSQPRWARRAMLHAIAGKALGAAMLLSAAQAAGITLGPADAVIIYATALGASMASLVPAGVGVVETSTGALLVSQGASIGVAAIAVALFRVMDLWIPVAAGALAVRVPMGTGRVDPAGRLTPALS